MKKIIIFLIPIIGFSQNCENSILDEVLQNENVNTYFQLALSFNIEELSYLNDCDSDVNYTMFVPGNNVPTASANSILTLGGDLIDYISYYIHLGDLSTEELINLNGTTIEMMDENVSTINYYDGPFINNALIEIGDICGCNGTIHIINDLIWANSVNIEEQQSLFQFYDPNEKTIKINPHFNYENINILDLNGKNINSCNINSHSINVSNLSKGLYLIEYANRNQMYIQKLLIN